MCNILSPTKPTYFHHYIFPIILVYHFAIICTWQRCVPYVTYQDQISLSSAFFKKEDLNISIDSKYIFRM